MHNRWSDTRATELADKYGEWEFVALRTYSSRLIGSEPSLVLHGGGNTSVKGVALNVFGARVPAILVKASGHDLATIELTGTSALPVTNWWGKHSCLPALSLSPTGMSALPDVFRELSPLEILFIAIPTRILPGILCNAGLHRIIQHVAEFSIQLLLAPYDPVERFMLPDLKSLFP